MRPEVVPCVVASSGVRIAVDERVAAGCEGGPRRVLVARRQRDEHLVSAGQEVVEEVVTIGIRVLVGDRVAVPVGGCRVEVRCPQLDLGPRNARLAHVLLAVLVEVQPHEVADTDDRRHDPGCHLIVDVQRVDVCTGVRRHDSAHRGGQHDGCGGSDSVCRPGAHNVGVEQWVGPLGRIAEVVKTSRCCVADLVGAGQQVVERVRARGIGGDRFAGYRIPV